MNEAETRAALIDQKMTAMTLSEQKVKEIIKIMGTDLFIQ